MTKNSTVEQLFALVQEYLPARAQGSAPEVTGELQPAYEHSLRLCGECHIEATACGCL